MLSRSVQVAISLLACGLLAGCPLLSPRGAAARPDKKKIELRISAAAAEAREDFEKQADEFGRPLYVSKEILASERDVWSAAAFVNANRGIVRLRFSAMAADRIARGAAAGDRLAIFIDGELLISPRLAEPLTHGRMLLDAGFTPKRAAEIAAALDGR